MIKNKQNQTIADKKKKERKKKTLEESTSDERKNFSKPSSAAEISSNGEKFELSLLKGNLHHSNDKLGFIP